VPIMKNKERFEKHSSDENMISLPQYLESLEEKKKICNYIRTDMLRASIAPVNIEITLDMVNNSNEIRKSPSRIEGCRQFVKHNDMPHSVRVLLGYLTEKDVLINSGMIGSDETLDELLCRLTNKK